MFSCSSGKDDNSIYLVCEIGVTDKIRNNLRQWLVDHQYASEEELVHSAEYFQHPRGRA